MKLEEFRKLVDWNKIRKLIKINEKLHYGLPPSEWGYPEIENDIYVLSLYNTIYDDFIENMLEKIDIRFVIEHIYVFADETDYRKFVDAYMERRNLTTANDEKIRKKLESLRFFDEIILLRPISFGRDYYATEAILTKKFEEGFILCVIVYL